MPNLPVFTLLGLAAACRNKNWAFGLTALYLLFAADVAGLGQTPALDPSGLASVVGLTVLVVLVVSVHVEVVVLIVLIVGAGFRGTPLISLALVRLACGSSSSSGGGGPLLGHCGREEARGDEWRN